MVICPKFTVFMPLCSSPLQIIDCQPGSKVRQSAGCYLVSWTKSENQPRWPYSEHMTRRSSAWDNRAAWWSRIDEWFLIWIRIWIELYTRSAQYSLSSQVTVSTMLHATWLPWNHGLNMFHKTTARSQSVRRTALGICLFPCTLMHTLLPPKEIT